MHLLNDFQLHIILLQLSEFPSPKISALKTLDLQLSEFISVNSLLLRNYKNYNYFKLSS